MEIANKVVLITGASSGIGAATAVLLHQRGAKIALAARSLDMLSDLANTLEGSLPERADLSEEADVKSMVKNVLSHFGRIDILINNAGQGYESLVENIDPKRFRYLLELNLMAPLIAMQSVIPSMRAQGGGMILNISSGTSFLYIPTVGAYSATKRSLNGLSLTARAELKKDNIRVSVVHPYITLTRFHKHLHVDPHLPPPDSAEFVAHRIEEAIISEKAEVFAHDWMRKNKRFMV